MNRRSFLAPVGAAITAGNPGCLQLFPEDEVQLWFLRIDNTSSRHVFDVRVRRNGDVTFEERFDLPSVLQIEEEDDTATFTDEINMAWVTGEWPNEPARFKVDYKFPEDDSWETFDCIQVDGNHLGVTVRPVGFRGPVWFTADPLVFESRARVDSFFRQIDGEFPYDRENTSTTGTRDSPTESTE